MSLVCPRLGCTCSSRSVGTRTRTAWQERRQSGGVVGADRHVTTDRALRYLGIGRRAIVPVVYAALRSLGRRGVATLIETSCAHAQRLASELAQVDGVEIVNDVRLNQVLVRFGDDSLTEAVLRRVLDERNDLARSRREATQRRELADES